MGTRILLNEPMGQMNSMFLSPKLSPPLSKSGANKHMTTNLSIKAIKKKQFPVYNLRVENKKIMLIN